METSNIPILKSGDCLISSPQIALHDQLAVQFKHEVLQQAIDTRAKGFVLDVSAIDVVDSFLVRQIGEISATLSIMGTQVIVVGIRPEVAMTLVEMGYSPEQMQTARNLEIGLKIIQKTRRK